jgi:hypothetical protein
MLAHANPYSLTRRPGSLSATETPAWNHSETRFRNSLQDSDPPSSYDPLFDSHRDIGDARHRFLPPRGTKFFTFGCCRSNKFTNRYRYGFTLFDCFLVLLSFSSKYYRF